MSLLVEVCRDMFKKDKDPRMSMEATADIGYPTGFPNFDFTNGSMINTINPETHEPQTYYSTGYGDGTYTMIIGRSGCGKTTYLAQSAANIIRPFDNGIIFEDSIEGGLKWNRRQELSNFSKEEMQKRYVVRNTGVTAENFYKRIKMIHDTKLSSMNDFMYDTGVYDIFGKKVYKLVPTVYILDSIAMLMPDKYTDEDDLSGNMATTSSARTIAQIFRTIIPMLKSANIMLFVINHIMEDVSINPMQHKKAQVAYLKQGERLPKGNTIIYLADNLIRLDDVSKLKEEESFRISGSIVELSLIKSRSNRANLKTKLVFNQDTGFDPLLSMFLFLKEAGRVNGAGVGMYFGERNDLKFSQKNFIEKITTNPELAKIFQEICAEELKKIPSRIGDNKDEIDVKKRLVDEIGNNIMSQINSSM